MVETTNKPSSGKPKPIKMREMAKQGFDMRQVEKLSKAMAAVMSKNMLKAKPDSKNHIDIALEDNRRQIDLMKLDIGIMSSNIGELRQDVKTSLGLLSETIQSIKNLSKELKEHAKKIMANQSSSSSSMLDLLSGAVGGLKTAGSVVKSGASMVGRGIAGAARGLGAAGKFAKGLGGKVLGAAGLGLSALEAMELYRDQSADLTERYGEEGKKKLGGVAQNAYRNLVTDREASLEEINRLTPSEASSVLENGSPKDIARYGKEQLEARAKNQPVTAKASAASTPSKEGGPEESKAVREKREELDKQERIEKSMPGVGPSTQPNTPVAQASSVNEPSGGGVAGPDGLPIAGGVKPVAETGDATRAMQSFMADGWTREQAAGIVGNLQAESGPNLKTDAKGDGGKAYGIAQWHPDRQAQFKRVYKKDIREAGFDEQLAFIKWELANSEARAGRLLRQAKTAAQAAAITDIYYERSAGKHRQQRIANAENLVKGSTRSTPEATMIEAATRSGDVGAPSAVTSAEVNKAGGGTSPAATAAPASAAGPDINAMLIKGAAVSDNLTPGAAAAPASATPTTTTIQNSFENIVNKNSNTTNTENNVASGGASQLPSFNATGRPDALNFKQDFAGSLGSFLTTAKQSGHGITIQSGFRSPELQSILFKQAVQKYGNETEARKWVAPPGQSNHGKGIAADLGYSSSAAKSWAHSNAQKFGLHFRMAHEPWHIEPTGTGGSNVDFNPDGTQTASSSDSGGGMGGGGTEATPVAPPTIAETKQKLSGLYASFASAAAGDSGTPSSSSAAIGSGVQATPVSAPTVAEAKQKLSNQSTLLASPLSSSAPAPIVRPSSPANSLMPAAPQTSPGVSGSMTGLVGAISNIGSMVGSMAGMIGALNTKPGYRDAPNPDLAFDENNRNSVPSAMPTNAMLAQLFDLNVGDRSKIPGYAFD